MSQAEGDYGRSEQPLTNEASTDDGPLQFEESVLSHSEPSWAAGDGQITQEMIQAAEQEIKTRFPVFYDSTELAAVHDLVRAIFLSMLAES
jgi:hypothetical protein